MLSGQLGRSSANPLVRRGIEKTLTELIERGLRPASINRSRSGSAL
jgi:hypothetical protein